MNIPHLMPIEFAKEALSVTQNEVRVKCIFEQEPTLAMFLEAAAQSSAAFAQDSSKIGFLISLKDVDLLKTSTSLEYIIKVKKIVQIGAINEFSFEVFTLNENKKIAKGNFTIMIQGS